MPVVAWPASVQASTEPGIARPGPATGAPELATHPGSFHGTPELATPAGLARHEFRAMGTTVTVIVPGPARGAVEAVASLFSAWESALSRFRPESELSRLNAAAGREVPVSPLLLSVVETAIRAARATDGLFDPTLLGAMIVAGYDRTFDDLPRVGPARVGPDRGIAGGWRTLRVDAARRTVTLPEGAGIDLGGIAKGMAVDASVELLAAAGVAPAAIDAGGDLAVRGLPPHQRSWPVRLELPGGAGRVLEIATGAVATSGVGRRNWVRGGELRHHLIDPRTGRPARGDAWSATVAAATCAQAEVAAKVVFMLGPEAGARFLLGHGLTGLCVRRDGRQLELGTWGTVHDAPDPDAPGRSAAMASTADMA